jgi:uncharacterized protein
MPPDLKTRLAALRGEVLPSATPSRADTLASLAARMERICTRARPAQTKKLSEHEVAAALRGERLADGVVVIDHWMPLTSWHGRVQLHAVIDAPLGALSREPVAAPETLLFLDTETTGLSGGVGTLVFLLGLARIDGEQVHLRQYLLTTFAGERAMLEDAATWIRAAGCLVSFNGKSFDVPLLAARYRLARLADPFRTRAHLDLLHPTRAAFARTWSDCRLQTAEKGLLKLFRDDDVPSHLIPQAWMQFIRAGDHTGLSGVLEHNSRDVLSLLALLAVVANTFAVPGCEDADALRIARAHQKRGGEGAALAHLTESAVALDAAGQLELARLQRRRGDWNAAVHIWQQLAQAGSVDAMQQLAKYHEHRRRDFATALVLTRRMLEGEGAPAAVLQRERRLLAKIERKSVYERTSGKQIVRKSVEKDVA